MPCEGHRLKSPPPALGDSTLVRICGNTEAGVIGLGILPETGPLAPEDRFVVYETEDGLRMTNQALSVPFPLPGWARAPRVTQEQVVQTHQGYWGWDYQQLQAEIALGWWTVLE